METASARGRRLPLIIVVLVVVAVIAAGLWLMNRGRSGGGADGQPVLLSLAFNPAACATAPDIPAEGWDYPQQPATVEKWVRDGDVARTRAHGWWLWAALNQVSQGQPLWRNWCTSTQAYPYQYETAGAAGSGSGAPALGVRREALTIASDPSINLPGAGYPAPDPGHCVVGGALRDGPSFANNTDVMVAGVIYNPTAYNSIVGGKLNAWKTLKDKAPPVGGIANVELAAGSVVLKPMMWPVKAEGYTALPVWGGGEEQRGVYAGFENKKAWPRAVAVTAQPQQDIVAVQDIQSLWGVQFPKPKQATQPKERVPLVTYKSAQVVPIESFYHYRPDVARLHPCDKAILDQSAKAAYNRAFKKGDYLVLVAMHIVTKEQPAWTFQSAYWSDRPNEGPNAADRPDIPAAVGPWRNYLMASTYGIAERTRDPHRRPVWGVHFNPYIELAAGHPVATNCMNCHMRGAFQPDEKRGDATYLTTDRPDDPGPIGVLRPDNPIFADLVRTDFQWSLPSRAGPKPPAAGAADKAPKR